MDTRTGEVFDYTQFQRKLKDMPLEDIAFFIAMKIAPTEDQLRRRPPRVEKYDPCPCGSGKKFKFCCYQKAKEIR